ncbi:hypothetical protein [Borrelia turicatae]|nr:hypothetical protein [Borrelia turicatae]
MYVNEETVFKIIICASLLVFIVNFFAEESEEFRASYLSNESNT